MKLCPKWKTFIWRIMHSALATNENLRIRNFSIKAECHFCGQDQETQAHLFRDCEVIKRVWKSSPLALSVVHDKSIPFHKWLSNYHLYVWRIEAKKQYLHISTTFLATLQTIWLHRNRVVFRRVQVNPKEILLEVLQKLGENQARATKNATYHVENTSLCMTKNNASFMSTM